MNQAYLIPLGSVGKDVVIWDNAKIVSPEVVSIGDSVIIDDFVFIMGGRETSLGSFVHIAAFSSLVGGGRLIMEDFSGLSSGCRIYTGNEDYLGEQLTNPAVPFPYRKASRSTVIIKKHVIIGANSVVLPGVVLGEGVAVGANSVVKKDCEPWTIYAGCPASPIKRRNKDTILSLERELRTALYDDQGNYIPSEVRSKGAL